MKTTQNINAKNEALDDNVLDIADNEPDNEIAECTQENNFSKLEDNFGSIADNDFENTEIKEKEEDFSKLQDSPEFPADIENS